MRGLEGKRVLITGAATGIGRATAIRFAEEGASVAVNFVGDQEPAEALIEELTRISPEGGHMLAPADISDEDAVDSLFAGVVQALEGLDILVNNAGIKIVHQPHEAAIADYDRVMAVNLRGAFLCAQAAIQHFLDTGRPGVIVTTSSVQAETPVNDDAIAYVMSKAGITGMTRALALRYGRDGIRINAVGPGAVPTDECQLRQPAGTPARRALGAARPRRAAGGDRQRDRVPRIGRRFLHHRADGLRRRWTCIRTGRR